MTIDKALNIVAGLCSKKEYCSKEIMEKLIKWEIQEKDIAKIMDFLYKQKFIDDARFARNYAEDKFRFNHWGKQKITLMLRQKGISQDIIQEALEILVPSHYEDGCLEILRQKLSTLNEPDPYKRKAKLVRFAVGRGFDFDTINKALYKLLNEELDEF